MFRQAPFLKLSRTDCNAYLYDRVNFHTHHPQSSPTPNNVIWDIYPPRYELDAPYLWMTFIVQLEDFKFYRFGFGHIQGCMCSGPMIWQCQRQSVDLP